MVTRVDPAAARVVVVVARPTATAVASVKESGGEVVFVSFLSILVAFLLV